MKKRPLCMLFGCCFYFLAMHFNTVLCWDCQTQKLQVPKAMKVYFYIGSLPKLQLVGALNFLMHLFLKPKLLTSTDSEPHAYMLTCILNSECGKRRYISK